MKLKLVQSSLIIVACLFIIQCANSGSASQLQPSPTPVFRVATNNNSMVLNAVSLDEQIESKEVDFEVADSSLEAILKQPAPEVWLAAACQEKTGADCIEGVVKKELPLEVKKLIGETWKDYLTYHYKNINNKFKDAQEQKDEETFYENKFKNFAEELKKMPIEAPNGKRNLSANETMKVIDILAKTAIRQNESAKIKFDRKL